ncbi:amidohydrolase family protein [uncultured Cyclobacterium sp.]|uniref:amidohydrolase n=1 Tax=uncultured Cyclobacterium sp. TaxID=453820 RepID=UPI0030EC114F|tara:strand:- start:186201 stop:187973 length:1773 start_codon:yes stop_codon:yes gene_type:complete
MNTTGSQQLQRRYCRLYPFVAILLITLACTTKTTVEKATLVIKGGKIYTLDPNHPHVDAIAIRDSLIVFAGLEKDLKDYIGSETQIITLSGRIVTPGWIEGHGHFMGLGYGELNLDLTDTKSYDEIVEKVKVAVGNTPPGNWIIGRGWHQSKWTKQPQEVIDGFPSHQTLSAISPHHPVVLFHASGHALFANAKAMEIAGIGPLNQELGGSRAISGGEVIRDSNGNPTGIFNENAMALIYNHIPESSEENNLLAFNLAQDACLRNGITSFHDAGVSSEILALYQEIQTAGQLKIRMYAMLDGNDKDLLKEWYEKGPKLNSWLNVRSIKLSADGALGSRGAWLLEEYSDRPDHYGHETIPMQEVFETAKNGIKYGFQLATHAIGDRANQEVLDQYEKALSEMDALNSDHRFRIEHAQHLHSDDIPRFASLGVIPSMQAIHLSSDRPWAIDRLGEKRITDGAYMWQALLSSGIPVINGTDVPVEPLSPMANFYASVTRKTLEGTPENGYEGNQKMTRMQALKSYTLSPAYGAFEEKTKGSISVGKLADLVVLNQDIMKINEEEILNTKVSMTILNGKIVYQKEGVNVKQPID